MDIDLKDHYYKMTIYGLVNGLTKEDLEETMSQLIDNEMYLEMAGIQKAFRVYTSSDLNHWCRIKEVRDRRAPYTQEELDALREDEQRGLYGDY